MLITLIVVIGLSILILGHELGHFVAARSLGMKVDEFGFGFPPRMFGFVKYKDKEGEKKRFRFFWGGKEPAQEENGMKRSETVYSINWLPFGGFVKIAGENDRLEGNIEKLDALPEEEKKCLFFFQKPWRRSVVMLAGVFFNFLIGWLFISLIFMRGTAPSLIVYEVQQNSPAEQVGIMPGDSIKGFKTAEEFINYVNDHRGEPIEIQIGRNNQQIELTVTPRERTDPNEGAVGVVFSGIVARGPTEGLKDGLVATWRMTEATVTGFSMLIKSLVTTGKIPGEIVGPVGIFSIAQDVGGLGLVYLLQLMALISINLAVINLIPFPALDGGRFLLIIVEKIKGSPIPRRAEAWINGVGFLLLILLMVTLTVRDVIRL